LYSKKNQVRFDINNGNCNTEGVTVTFAIPSFNHSDYIGELLSSILDDIASSSFTYEILIIDDGSTDNTHEIIKKFSLNHPNVFLNAIFCDNVGISKNLNRIVKESNGEFIRLCASDDVVIAGSTNSLIRAFDLCNYCVVGDGDVINSAGNIVSNSLVEFHSGNKSNLLSSETIYHEIISNYSFAGPCLLIRKRFFDFYSYDTESKIDDYDFFVSLVTLTELNTVKFIDENVCKYRVHNTNTSKSKNLNTRLENQVSMFYLLNKFIKKNHKGSKSVFIKKMIIVALKIVYLKMMLVVDNKYD